MTVHGRMFEGTLEVTYAGAQPLQDDAMEALEAAIQVNDFELTVRTAPRSKVTVRATIRAANPVEAVTRLSEAVDRAMMTTGLFEEFDVTGKVLHVEPAR